MQRATLVGGALLGALAVGLGAFGAHGLEGVLEGAADAARRLEWWRTAVSYHLPHAAMIVVCALVPGRAARVASAAFAAGITLFAGTLYAMSLGAPRWLGAVTPLGGLALIAGWIALAFTARRALTPPARSA